jgi:hypothetical protein
LARYDVYPIGSSQGQVSVGGRNWELWYGYNGAMQVYSFVATSTITNYNGNIKDFFNWLASNRNYPANNQYLISMCLPFPFPEARLEKQKEEHTYTHHPQVRNKDQTVQR